MSSLRGFLYGTLVVPRFVIAELQHIADQRDQTAAPAGGAASRCWPSSRRTRAWRVELSDENPTNGD